MFLELGEAHVVINPLRPALAMLAHGGDAHGDPDGDAHGDMDLEECWGTFPMESIDVDFLLEYAATKRARPVRGARWRYRLLRWRPQ